MKKKFPQYIRYSHALIKRLEEFHIKDWMWPKDEQAFDNAVTDVVEEMHESMRNEQKPFIEWEGFRLSVNAILCMQVEKNYKRGGMSEPTTRIRLATIPLTFGAYGPQKDRYGLFEIVGKDAERIERICKRLEIKEDENFISNIE